MKNVYRVIGVLFFGPFVVLAMLLLFICIGVYVLVAITFASIYIRSNTHKKYVLRIYEMQQSIVSVLRMELYKKSNNNGWVDIRDLFLRVSTDFAHEENSNVTSLFTDSLKMLTDKKAVYKEQLLYLQVNENGYEGEIIIVYKYNTDSDYTPRKPRRLPEKKKEKDMLPDGLPA